ncbi:MAG: FAD:protein FMN transferase [Sedimenticolaceae bacterium]
MSMSRRAFLNTCLGLGVVAVAGRNAAHAAVEREQWYLFGTLVDVTLADVTSFEAHSAFSDLSAALQQMNRDWHPWEPGVMGDINQALAKGEGITIDHHMAHMVSEIKTLHAASRETFNPAIGKVVAQWGFHGRSNGAWQPPDSDSIDGVLSTSPSPRDLDLVDNRLSSTNTEVQLDLGGYAKGYALALGLELLGRLGVRNAMINAGGDLVTLGRASSGWNERPWRVAVRHPQRPGVVAWLETMSGEAVFTSGNYERYHEYRGVRYQHIIDPRSGRPATGLISATVVHDNAALADAAATALVVAGPTVWREVAASLGVARAMVVDERGRIQTTPEMARRVHLQAV